MGRRGPDFSVGHRVGGRFCVEGVLGAGSSGVVYDVLDERIGQRAALKVLWDAADESSPSFQRIRREVLVAQAIRDPRVVAIHDLLLVEGCPALLMERVKGSSLRARILQDGAFTPDEALRIMGAVLGALSLLHGSGIVHRDVKSANILLASDGQVKLGDFGLVKVEAPGATLTATGIALGTPSYMAPEVIRGEDATAVSDLYSAGVVLFEMLAGRLPFDGSSGLHVAHRHLSDPPPLHLLREKGTPGWLTAMTARLLEKDPRDRYASAEEALQALDTHRAAGVIYRAMRTLKKHAGLLLVIAALIAAGGTWSLYQVHASRPLVLSFHDRILEARDTSGRLAWTQTLPRKIQSVCTGAFGPSGSQAAACAVEWDDKVHGVETAVESASSVWVYDREGKFVERLSLEAMGKGYPPHYVVNLSAHRFAPGEAERLVAYARHYTWHPTGLFVFCLAQRPPWEQQRRADVFFFNSGAISGWTYQDLDGDGRDDILCGGVNMPVFWADFAAGLKVGPPGGIPASFTSPDFDDGRGMAPLFYRFFSFESYIQFHLWKEASGRTRLGFGDQTPWTFGPKGEFVKPGWRGAPDAGARAFNALLPRLTYLRENRQWETLLAESEKIPMGLSDTNDWIRRLYRSYALMALGRGGEMEDMAASVGGGDAPPYAYQITMDASFLGGRFDHCGDLYASFPEALRRNKPELGNTLLLSALFSENGKTLPEEAASNQVFAYTWYPAMLLAAQECLQGDFVSGEHTIRAMGPERDQEAGPRLWLAECLLRQGKMKEARQALAEAERWHDESPREPEEAEIWIQWCSGARTSAQIQRFSALVDDARKEARSSPRARAFLPLTLARAAHIQARDGDRALGRKLLAEALKLAPKNWAKVLSAPPPRAKPKA